MCRTEAACLSAACARARNPGELSQGAVTMSATAAAIASVAAAMTRRLRPESPPKRRRLAGAEMWWCWRSAAARSSCFRSSTGSLMTLPFAKLGVQRRQATTDAFADDALRKAPAPCNLGIAALVDVMRLDRLALLGS